MVYFELSSEINDLIETKEYLKDRLEKTKAQKKIYNDASEEIGKKLPGRYDEFHTRLTGLFVTCAVNRGKEERLLKKTLKALDEKIKELKEKEGLE